MHQDGHVKIVSRRCNLRIGSFDFDGETYYHEFDGLSIYIRPDHRIIDLDPGIEIDDLGILSWDSKKVVWHSEQAPLETRTKLLNKVKELEGEITNLFSCLT